MYKIISLLKSKEFLRYCFSKTEKKDTDAKWFILPIKFSSIALNTPHKLLVELQPLKISDGLKQQEVNDGNQSVCVPA